jgi:hypothetical protein
LPVWVEACCRKQPLNGPSNTFIRKHSSRTRPPFYLRGKYRPRLGATLRLRGMDLILVLAGCLRHQALLKVLRVGTCPRIRALRRGREAKACPDLGLPVNRPDRGPTCPA